MINELERFGWQENQLSPLADKKLEDRKNSFNRVEKLEKSSTDRLLLFELSGFIFMPGMRIIQGFLEVKIQEAQPRDRLE